MKIEVEVPAKIADKLTTIVIRSRKLSNRLKEATDESFLFQLMEQNERKKGGDMDSEKIALFQSEMAKANVIFKACFEGLQAQYKDFCAVLEKDETLFNHLTDGDGYHGFIDLIRTEVVCKF